RQWAAAHQVSERRWLERSGTRRGMRAGGTWATAPMVRLPRAVQDVRTRAIRASALQRTLVEGEVFLDFFLHDGAVGVIAMDHDRIAARANLIEEADLMRMVHALLFELRGAVFTPAHERTAGEELKDAFADLAGLILWPALAALARDSWPT